MVPTGEIDQIQAPAVDAALQGAAMPANAMAVYEQTRLHANPGWARYDLAARPTMRFDVSSAVVADPPGRAENAVGWQDVQLTREEHRARLLDRLIVVDARRRNVTRAAMIMVLPLQFLFGPAGFAIYLVFRSFASKAAPRSSRQSAAKS